MRIQHLIKLESVFVQLQETMELTNEQKIQVNVISNHKSFERFLTDAIDTNNEEIFNEEFFEEWIFANIAASTHHPIIYFAPPNRSDCGWICLCIWSNTNLVNGANGTVIAANDKQLMAEEPEVKQQQQQQKQEQV